MKKIILILLGLAMGLKGMAKDDLLSLGHVETRHVSSFYDLTPGRVYDPSKVKSRLCWIPGLVLAGSGGIVFAFSGIFINGARERDPVKFKEIQRERNTGMIIGLGMIASSIPLFILARHYRHQGMYETVLNFKVEPVEGYMGQTSPVAAIGVNIGL